MSFAGTRWRRWTSVAVLLAALGAAGFVLYAHVRPAAPKHEAADVILRNRRPSAAPVQVRPLTNKSLLVVGASYTQGLGASRPDAGYAYLLGRRLGWSDTVAGVAGTGFINPGPLDQGNYASRISRLPASLHPGVVLVQCGRNDVNYPLASLHSAIVSTVRLIRDRFDSAQLVFLGPIPGSAPISPALRREAQYLSSTAHGLGVPFIDPIAENWITPENAHKYSGPVPGHPGDEGYSYIAARTATDIARMLTPDGSKPVTGTSGNGGQNAGGGAGASSPPSAPTPKPVVANPAV